MTRRIAAGAALLAVVALLPGSLIARSQTPSRPASPAPAPAGTAAMSGTVQASETHRPARRTRVTLVGGTPRISRTTMTGDQGEFSFSDLPPGEFTLSATKPGWLDSSFGQKRAGSGRPGTPIALAAGQRLENLVLPLARGGVLTGLVLDEQGEPAFGTPVRAMRYSFRNGERQPMPAGATTTDDRGIYRIPGLLPGDYIVAAVPREADGPVFEEKARMEEVAAAKMQMAQAASADMAAAVQDMQKLLESMSAPADPARAPTSGYAPVYYPGTTIGSSATVIALGTSEEKSGVDLQLQIVPLARLSGSVFNPDGSAANGAQVMLIDAGQGLPGVASRTARAGGDGRFTFTGLQQGPYTIVARAGQALVASAMPDRMTMVATASGAGPGQTWAILDVTVDTRNESPLSLTLQPGMSVAGTLAFDGGPAPADLSRVRLALTPVGAGAASELGGSIRPAALDADRRFTFSGLIPGKYRVAIASSAGLSGWSMRSALAAGQDTLDLPLEIKPNESINGLLVTMTTRATDLRGLLQGPAGQPAPDYTVIVFAADNRFWTPQSRRIQAMRPSTDGRYAFRDLPPGDYRIAAVSDVEPGAWLLPDFLRQLVGASTMVALADGERKTQDIRLSSKF